MCLFKFLTNKIEKYTLEITITLRFEFSYVIIFISLCIVVSWVIIRNLFIIPLLVPHIILD